MGKIAVIAEDYLKYIPVPDALWKVKGIYYDNGVMVGCTDSEVIVTGVRRKN